MQKKRVWGKNFLLLILLWSTINNFLLAETTVTKGNFGVIVGDEINTTTGVITNTIKEYYLEEKGTGKYFTLDLNNTEQILWNKYLNKNVKIKLKTTVDSIDKSYQDDDISNKRYKIIDIYKIVDMMHGRAKKVKISNQNKYKKPWLNLLCKVADVDTEPETPEQIAAMFGNSYPFLEDYWKKTTYGLVDISGTKTISKWVTMEHNKDYYLNKNNWIKSNKMQTDCLKAASKLVDTSLYSHINIFYNIFSRGALGGGRCTSFPTWAHKKLGVIAHEMGHSYGFPHSFVKWSSNPYDNSWDVMSVSSSDYNFNIYRSIPKHTIAYNKERIGAIKSKHIFNYQRSTENTKDVHITRLENIPIGNSYSIVHVYSADKNKHYVVEVRDNTADKYDKVLRGKGVFIYDVVSTYKLELIRESHTIVNKAMFKPGDIFNDIKNDISIQVLEEAEKGYKIRIGAAKSNIQLTNPNPMNATTVIEGINGQELKINAPGAISAIFYYDICPQMRYSKMGEIIGDQVKVTIPYKSNQMNNDGKNYWYVIVKNSEGVTTSYPESGKMSFTVTPMTTPKPTAPTNLHSNNIQKTTATLTWTDKSNNETGFKIYRGNTLVKTVGANIKSFKLTGLTPNTNYTYSVKAYNTVGESPATTTSFKTLPNNPGGVIVSNPNPANHATVTEGANGQELKVKAPNAVSAVFYYDDDSKISYHKSGQVVGDEAKVTIPYQQFKMKKNGTNYWYVVVKNSVGKATRYPANGQMSFTVKLMNTPIPTAPSNLHSSNVQKTTATLTWADKSNNETGFEIYRGNTLVKTVGANVKSFNLTGLTPNTNYTYSVKAYNTVGESPATTTSFKTLPDTTTFTKAHITSPTAGSTLTSSTLTVTWDKNSASKVWLYVYDTILRKYIFSGYLTGTSKTIPVSTKGGRLYIGLYTYISTSAGYKGVERISVITKK